MWPPQPSKAFPCPLATKSQKTMQTKDTLSSNGTLTKTGLSVDSVKCRKKLKIKRELHKKNKIVRPYNIKHLNKTTMNETMKSKTTCIARIFDHALPIDTTFLEPNDAGANYIHPILGSLSSFKRITSIVFDQKTDEYNCRIENRYFNPSDVKSSDQKFYKVEALLRVLKNSYKEYSTQLHF